MFHVEHKEYKMNIRDIQDISDIMTLNKEDLNNVIKQLREINRGRVKNLKKLEKETGYTSPALSHYKREKSIKNKNLNELRNIFKKEYNFYNAKTSSVKGAKKYKKEVEERFGKGANAPGFWEAFEYFKENSTYLYMFDPSEQIRIASSFYDTSKTLEEMLEEMDNYLSGVYNASQGQYNDEEWEAMFNDF